MPANDVAANGVLNFYLNNNTPGYALSSTWYVGLSRTLVEATGTGVSEPATGNYARVAIIRGSGSWDAAVDSAISNSTKVSFPKATTNWGEMKSIFLSNTAALNSAASTIYFHQALIPTLTVNMGTTVEIGAGNLVIKRDSTPYGTE